MVVFVDVVSNWVTRTVIVNKRFIVVDSESDLSPFFTNIIALPVTTFVERYSVLYIKYRKRPSHYGYILSHNKLITNLILKSYMCYKIR